MDLFYSHASPYARTCRVMLREKKLQSHVNEIEINPLENPPQLFQRNPLGKIPCLILDNGDDLFDSVVINDYFNQHGAGPDLFAAHQRDWQVKKWQALSQGILDVAVQLRIEKTKPKPQHSALWMQRNRDALARAAKELNTQFDALPTEGCFLSLHLACAFAYLDFRHAEVNWRQCAPRVAHWYEDIRHHPSLLATAPK